LIGLVFMQMMFVKCVAKSPLLGILCVHRIGVPHTLLILGKIR
jgi:hypothetical protein